MFVYDPTPDGTCLSREFPFRMEDQTVNVSLKRSQDAPESRTDSVLIRIRAPFRGTWLTSAQVFVDQAPASGAASLF